VTGTGQAGARLVLLRHAAAAQAGERCAGRGRAFDPGLESLGREQAIAAVGRLGREFDLVVSSPARRARETVAAWDLPAAIDERLAERSFGDWEGRRWTELRPRVPTEALASPEAYAAFTPPGGEPYQAVAARVLNALDELTGTPGRRVLAVTHAGPLRPAAGAALGLEPAVALTLGAGSARAAVLERHGDRWVLDGLNC
jgi:ribonuclease H / adenosylcobalamin/alpha-ribazole phosphatase